MGSEANSSEVELVVNCSEGTEDSWVLLDNIDVLVGGYGTIALAALGVCANILAISVFSKKSFKSNFNNLLIALAVFDLLFLVICITESVRRTFEDVVANSSSVSGFATQVHHFLFPYFLYPLHNILLTCSIFMTISISIERYLAIFHPLVYRNRSSIWNLCCHIIPVFISAVLINIPKFFESKVVMEEDMSWIDVTEMRRSVEYTVYYQHWTRFLVLGIIPLVLLLFFNLKIFIYINSHKSSSKEMTYSTILLLIVAIFILCHMPRVALNFYEVLYLEEIEQCGPPVWSMTFSVFSNSLLPALNCAINFAIYFATGKKFRKSLLKMFKVKNEHKELVLSKSSVISDIKSDKIEVWEERKDSTEMEEMEHTQLLRM